MASTRGRSMVNERKAAMFVFGSSTPRDLSYMNKVPQEFRAYDSKPQKMPPPNKDETLQHYMRQARSLTPHLSGSREGSCDRMRSSFAFGSSTPRQFSHLSTIQPELRVYDAKMTPKVDKRSYTTSMITSLRSRTVPATARLTSRQLPPKPQKNNRKRSEQYGSSHHDLDEVASEPDFVQNRTTHSQQKNEEFLNSIKKQFQSDLEFKRKQHRDQQKALNNETISSREVITKESSPKKESKKIEKHHRTIRTTTSGDGEKMAASVEKVVESVKRTGKETSAITGEHVIDLPMEMAPSCIVPQTISNETNQLIAKNTPMVRPLNDSSAVTVISDVKTTPEEQRLNGFLGELKSEGTDLNLNDESSSVQKSDSTNAIDTHDHHTEEIDSTETKSGIGSSFDTTLSNHKHASQKLESEEEGSNLESQLLDTRGKGALKSGTAERNMELPLATSTAYETKTDTKSNVRFVEANHEHLSGARSPQFPGTENAPDTDTTKKSPGGGDQSFSSHSDSNLFSVLEQSAAEPTEAPKLGSLKRLDESEYERSPEDMTRSIHEDISASDMAESMHESANSSEGIRSIHDADENSVNVSSTDINKILSPSTAKSTTDTRSFHESAHSPQYPQEITSAVDIFSPTAQQTTNQFLLHSPSQSPMDGHDRASPNQSLSSIKNQSIDQMLHDSSDQGHAISQAYHSPTQQKPDQPAKSDEKNVLSSNIETVMTSSVYAIQDQHSPERETYYIHQQHHKQPRPKEGSNEPGSVMDSHGNRTGVDDSKGNQYGTITSDDESPEEESRADNVMMTLKGAGTQFNDNNLSLI